MSCVGAEEAVALELLLIVLKGGETEFPYIDSLGRLEVSLLGEVVLVLGVLKRLGFEKIEAEVPRPPLKDGRSLWLDLDYAFRGCGRIVVADLRHIVSDQALLQLISIGFDHLPQTGLRT